jgi:hypothetical protein
VLGQASLLCGRWREPVAGHKSNLVATTDILEAVKRRFMSGPAARVSSPRIR